MELREGNPRCPPSQSHGHEKEIRDHAGIRDDGWADLEDTGNERGSRSRQHNRNAPNRKL